MSAADIPVGGLAPFTTIDWPGRLAAAVFLRGCPWRCPYCHNADLQRVAGPRQPFSEVLDLLEQRRGFLDGVVFSGGEPTMHRQLPVALRQVRRLGFATALHTGGAYPEILEQILAAGLVDWVGFDVKAPFEHYQGVTGRADSGARARRSLELLQRSGVEYELRTTVYRPLLGDEQLQQLAGQLGPAAANRLVLQQARESGGGGDDASLQQLAARLVPLLGQVGVR
ncbi:MAG: anaerobic ribonucleoside-triphosphate reductase activating protein [Deltaproteobacteria bacterium]|nr:MAG: anaerobic ribonucleoside-triphosphate reductase activating protein [Deltaproteobacteria bacterium]